MNTAQCIRCDAEVKLSWDGLSEKEYRTLTYDGERSALPLCDSCFGDVEDRELWGED